MSGGFTFGAKTTVAPPPAFSSTPAQAFGTTQFGGALGSGTPNLQQTTNPATTQTGTLFGVVPAPNPTAPSTAIGFGSNTAGAPVSGSGNNFGLGGSNAAAAPTTTTTSTQLSINPSAATSSTTSSNPIVGLGGVATSQHIKQTAKTNVTPQKEVAPKDQPLPNEFIQLVVQFREFVQLEKTRSAEVARSSVKEYREIEEDLEYLNNQVTQVDSQLQSDKSLAESLKLKTAKGLQNIEIAQKTQETPPGRQYDNTAPQVYFYEIVKEFELEMRTLKKQIESTERFIKRKNNDDDILESEDLSLSLRNLHNTFVSLAGRIQSLHNQVEMQKELYVSVRKHLAGPDFINPFDSDTKVAEAMQTILENEQARQQQQRFASGPTPFNSLAMMGACAAGLNSEQQQQQQQQSQTIAAQPQPAQTQHLLLVPPPAYPSSSAPSTGFNTSFQVPTNLGSSAGFQAAESQRSLLPAGGKRKQ